MCDNILTLAILSFTMSSCLLRKRITQEQAKELIKIEQQQKP